MNSILQIFILSLIAGLGMDIGRLIAILRTPGKRMFGFLIDRI
jgi:hypothetical protein